MKLDFVAKPIPESHLFSSQQEQIEHRDLRLHLVFPTDLYTAAKPIPEEALDHAETAFSMIGGRFGYRIKCRLKTGQKNEVRSKIAAHNIRMLAWISFKSGN